MKKVHFFTTTILAMALILSCTGSAHVVADNGVTKIFRKVVSYRLYGGEFANQVDHTELEWGHEKENWTLKMTICLKDGGERTVTLIGGDGTLGDTMTYYDVEYY
jgi:hypothetical protein